MINIVVILNASFTHETNIEVTFSSNTTMYDHCCRNEYHSLVCFPTVISNKWDQCFHTPYGSCSSDSEMEHNVLDLVVFPYGILQCEGLSASLKLQTTYSVLFYYIIICKINMNYTYIFRNSFLQFSVVATLFVM